MGSDSICLLEGGTRQMDSTEANYLQVCLKAFPKVFKDKYGTSIHLATKVGARTCNLERIVAKQQTTPERSKKGFLYFACSTLEMRYATPE